MSKPILRQATKEGKKGKRNVTLLPIYITTEKVRRLDEVKERYLSRNMQIVKLIDEYLDKAEKKTNLRGAKLPTQRQEADELPLPQSPTMEAVSTNE
jgi:hypothetical protein